MERAIFFPLPCLLVRLSLAWGCSLTHLSLTFHLASPSPHRNCKRLCRSDPFSLSLMLQKRLLPRRQWKPQWNIQIKRFLKSGAQRKKISEPVETVWEYYENVLKYHFCFSHYWILMTWNPLSSLVPGRSTALFYLSLDYRNSITLKLIEFFNLWDNNN